MIEITNLKRSPIQLVVKSKRTTNSYSVINLPGIGNGKNKILIEDNIHTRYIDDAERSGYIKQRVLND
jgi:hypothetical protein